MVEFGQMSFTFHIVSPVVHTLLPSVLQGLDSRGTDALILILKKVNCIGPILLPRQVGFFHVGEDQENMEGDQPVEIKPYSDL